MKIVEKIKGNKKPKIPHYAALDIGTEFVKALVFKVGEGGKAHVMGVGRQRQRLGDMQGGTVTDIGGVVENCAKALDAAEEMAGEIAESCIIGIAGELVKGTTTTVHYERLKPKIKIDYNELKNIVGKIQSRVFEEARKQLAWETGHEEIDVKLVNASVVDVKIDGYRVTNPIGFQGKEVSVGVFNAFAPMVHLGALQSVAADLDLDLITIAAEPYAVARSLGAQEAGEFNAIFIDIGGGTTDIAVVASGGLEGTRMFAIGGRSFTKRLSANLNVPFARAEEIKLAYSEDLLKEKSKKIVRDALYADSLVWRSGVELALSEFSSLDLLPSRILLCGGGSALPEIKEVLSEAGWYKDLPFSKKPSIHFIKPTDVVNIVDETKKLTDQQDITPMGLANLVIEMGEEDVLPSLMRKITKTMQA
ncbi:MAG: cell division FtsA domain-containing protein [Patescibacteria group bacterium]|nr:cell division FtsA domain-containing protein [Patescibacteria group bacterium]